MMTRLLMNQQQELGEIKNILQTMKNVETNIKNVATGGEGECLELNKIDKHNLDKLFRSYIDRPSSSTNSSSCDIFNKMMISEFDTPGLEDYIKMVTKDKLFYRFEPGCKSIKVLHHRTNADKIELPCSRPISEIKGLQSIETSCCPFHHLAAKIKEIMNSLKVQNKIKDSKKSLRSWRILSLC